MVASFCHTTISGATTNTGTSTIRIVHGASRHSFQILSHRTQSTLQNI